MATVSSPSMPQRVVTGLGSLALVIGGLYWAQRVLIPVALAVLFTFVLTPVVVWMQKHRVPRAVSVGLTVLLAFGLLGSLLYVISMQLRALATEIPEHSHTIAAKINQIQGDGTGIVSRFRQMFVEIGKQVKKEAGEEFQPPEKPKGVIIQNEPTYFSWLPAVAGPVVEGLASTALIVMLVIFMLINREDLRFRLIQLIGHGRLTVTTHALEEAGERISAFLLMQTAVNAMFGTLLCIGLYFIGVPYAFLWGFLAAVLRFLPFVGTWLSLVFPLAISIAISPGWFEPIGVFLIFLVLELVTANVVEPLLFSHSTGVSAIALLIAAAFWTWLWGPLGLVMATPMTVCLVVLGRYVPQLSFFDTLFGSEPCMDTEVRYYQRLLAQDEDEASDLVDEFQKTHPPENVFDEVLVPALVLMKRDRDRGELPAEHDQYIHRATREIVEYLESEAVVPEAAEPRKRVIALGCPARDEADEIALIMFRHLMAGSNCDLEVMTSHKLTSEMVEQVKNDKPAFVFVAALPPGGLAHASYLCKRLRAQLPDVKILVGRWGQKENVTRVAERLQAAGADFVATTLLESRAQAIPLAQVAAAPTLVPERKQRETVASK